MRDEFTAPVIFDLEPAFAALGDPVRRALVSRLAQSDATVSELVKPFGLTQQTLAHHVRILRRCGLIEQRREGTRRPCHLRADRLSLLGTWIDDQHRIWANRPDTGALQPNGSRRGKHR